MINEQTLRCKRLVAAVVIQAINDHHANIKKHGATKAMSDQVGRWFMSENESPFSFIWCCDVLGIHQDKIRSNLNKSYFGAN